MKQIRILSSVFFLVLMSLMSSSVFAAGEDFVFQSMNGTNFRYELAPGSLFIDDIFVQNLKEEGDLNLEIKISKNTALYGSELMPSDWLDIPDEGSLIIPEGGSFNLQIAYDIPDDASDAVYITALIVSSVDSEIHEDESMGTGLSVEAEIGYKIVIDVNSELLIDEEVGEEMIEEEVEVGEEMMEEEVLVKNSFKKIYSFVENNFELILIVIVILLLLRLFALQQEIIKSKKKKEKKKKKK